MGTVVTLGEMLLRLSPPGNSRFLQTDCFDVTYGGSEANVAVSLAVFGKDSRYVTKLPAHEIGQAAVNTLRRYGVDTSKILRGGDRIGIYFLEKGASQRSSNVVYDRANSAITQAGREEFDWESIFSDASWFHFSGITPALGEEACAICLDACKAAKAAGITVSCDLNFRKKLWTAEQAGAVMREFMPYLDLCIANEDTLADLFGICSAPIDVVGKNLTKRGYQTVARIFSETFPGVQLALTIRTSHSASDHSFAGMLCTEGVCHFSKRYDIHIVDRVGGGDAFCAGLIYGLQTEESPQQALEFAVAASTLKHSIEGDANLSSVSEVWALVAGDGSGRVQR
jgi:2-dehydro-3-deoxygluconokinase